MPAVFVRLKPEEKAKLEKKAKELGLQTATFCRMILLRYYNQF